MRKINVITGASSGIGFEFARQMYRDSNSVDNETVEFWLISRDFGRLEEARRRILEEVGVKERTEIKPIAMDVSGSEGVGRFRDLLLRERAAGELRIDTLVNNAGFGTYGEFRDTDVGREMEMVRLNCESLTGICGVAMEFLDGGSKIVNVASLAAFLPLGNFAVYAATKAYVLSFSIALAAELKDRGIAVTALCPGSVSTNFALVASNGARKEVLHGKNPEKVVEHCLKCVRKGKRTAIWAMSWKFTAFMSRFVGRYAGARYTFLFNKRPHAPDGEQK